MGGRFVWWKTALVNESPTLAAAPDLVVAAALAAGAAGAQGAVPGVAPDPTPDLVPIATRDVRIPAPDLEGSLAPSQEKENHILAIAGLFPGLANLNLNLVLALAPASPNPVRPIGNPSLAQRAVLR